MHANVETEAGLARIRLNGRFDFSAHRIFRESYTPSLDAGSVAELEIDLDQVDYLDSSALGMLLMLREKAQDRQLRQAVHHQVRLGLQSATSPGA